MMSGNFEQRDWIGYQDPDIYHIPFPYPWAIHQVHPEDFLRVGLERLTSKGVNIGTDISGFMLETFQGWGALFYPSEFVKSIKNICDEYNILLAFDEMQAGFARTGAAFGFEHYGVKPDLIACGKGMGGGMPLSGVLGRAEIMDLPDIGNMSSTHSANPLACAAGNAVIEEIEAKDLIKEAARKGVLLFGKLQELRARYPHRIDLISGKGLIAAIIFRHPETGNPDALFPSRVAEFCMQKGLLVVHTGRESIKLGPPLTITDEALLEGLEVIGESILEAELA